MKDEEVDVFRRWFGSLSPAAAGAQGYRNGEETVNAKATASVAAAEHPRAQAVLAADTNR